jgi:hypothetical protein
VNLELFEVNCAAMFQHRTPMSDFPMVLTLEAAAERLQTTPEKLFAELESGRLKGFRIGTEWRTTEGALRTFMGDCGSAPLERTPSMTTVATTSTRNSLDFPSILAGAEWRRVDPFEYQWPKKKTDVDKRPEFYEEAYAARFKFARDEVSILIGFCNRESAGDKERRRAVVFLGDHPEVHASKMDMGGWRPPRFLEVLFTGRLASLYPLVEFSGENSEAFAATGLMASVIKLTSGEHLRPGDPVPAEYADLPLVTYNQLVVGPYAAESLAVVAHKEDFSLMARHALIRARDRNMI